MFKNISIFKVENFYFFLNCFSQKLKVMKKKHCTFEFIIKISLKLHIISFVLEEKWKFCRPMLFTKGNSSPISMILKYFVKVIILNNFPLSILLPFEFNFWDIHKKFRWSFQKRVIFDFEDSFILRKYLWEGFLTKCENFWK